MDHDQPALHLPDPVPAQEALQRLHNQEPGRGQNCRAIHISTQYSDRGKETESNREISNPGRVKLRIPAFDIYVNIVIYFFSLLCQENF